VKPDLVHPPLSDLAGAERVFVHTPGFVSLGEVAQDLDVRAGTLTTAVQLRFLAHCLEITVDGLLHLVDVAMDQTNVQLPNVVAMEALAHLCA